MSQSQPNPDPVTRAGETHAVGVDACPGGWVAIVFNNLRFASSLIKPTIAEILRAIPNFDAIAVDIPIGLPEDGRRPSDEAARRFVGARRSSVFFTPSRRLLEGKWSAGLGISRQAHSMGPRILQVERALTGRIYEVHPEVSFAAMNGGPLSWSKACWNGLHERQGLLLAEGIEIPGYLDMAGAAEPDDVLDAAAAAWSAHRVATGQAKTLPETPLNDGGGRPVAIWY